MIIILMISLCRSHEPPSGSHDQTSASDNDKQEDAPTSNDGSTDS